MVGDSIGDGGDEASELLEGDGERLRFAPTRGIFGLVVGYEQGKVSKRFEIPLCVSEGSKQNSRGWNKK